jgi:MYXO-CTERM domain-containing protein
MVTRSTARGLVFSAVIAATLVGVGLVIPLAGTAGAAQTVSLSPAGPYDNGQSVTVTGAGFTGIPSTGLQILECSDPDGTTANLPTDSTTGCDGTTVSGNTIIPNPTTGDFTTSYQVLQLSIANGNTINCDNTGVTGDANAHECVLWVGEDYVNQFLTGPHAFSAPFAVSSVVATTPEAPLALALPAAAALVVGAYVFVRRRRQHAPPNAA